ncbi:MAG: hypothetical protein U0324_45730 [Polyangiales bacterium]
MSLDPVSGAQLGVARWPWREAEDWALWIAQWPALHLFTSDLCAGLVGAVPLVGAARGMPRASGDYFHESARWTEKDFDLLSRRERLRVQHALTAWDGATRAEGPGRRVIAAKVERAEAPQARAEGFYDAVRLEEMFQRLLQPLSPERTLRSDARVEDLHVQFAREAGRCRRSTRRGSTGTSAGIGRAGAPPQLLPSQLGRRAA